MNEQIYDRPVRFGRVAVLEDFRLIGQAIGDALRTLNHKQFDAPWRRKSQEPKAC